MSGGGKSISAKNKSAVLIFITALAEYVFQAFDVGAFHYLVKPFSDEKFAEVLGAAQVQSRRTCALPVRKEKYIWVNRKGIRTKVLQDDIQFAEIYIRKIILHRAGACAYVVAAFDDSFGIFPVFLLGKSIRT